MLEEIRKNVKNGLRELLEVSGLGEGDLFVLGGSTSEVVGGRIGKNSSEEVGVEIIKVVKEILDEKKINLAVQGCEHINRSLVIERSVAKARGYDEVNVVPALHAGGAMSMATYKAFEDPIMVEHIVAEAGMDIGDTEIGMHVKFVQVPVRLGVKNIGQARLTALRSRAKLVGGDRAVHY